MRVNPLKLATPPDAVAVLVAPKVAPAELATVTTVVESPVKRLLSWSRTSITGCPVNSLALTAPDAEVVLTNL